jgi:hypothetical protein
MTLRWNWGVGIALVYTAFAAATAGVVAFAMDQPADLVSADYYERSLGYDQRLDASQRADALGTGLTLRIDETHNELIVSMPPAMMRARGTITFYRPDDARRDQSVALALDSHGTQHVSTAALARGWWRVELQWTSEAHSYYHQEPVTLQ